MTTFKLDPDVDTSMTAFHGHMIRLPLASLVEALGPAHIECTSGKTLHEWLFSDEGGRPVTLYDYKGSQWHVVAREPAMADAFVRWFQTAVKP